MKSITITFRAGSLPTSKATRCASAPTATSPPTCSSKKKAGSRSARYGGVDHRSPFRSNATGEGKMRKPIILFCAAASLGACGQSTNDVGANESAANAAAEAPKPAYCFFKDSETKDWKAKLDKRGNVVITGKAYREDPRYKAILSPAAINGMT